MAKFARDCMLRMERLLEELAPSLGKDTIELAFRVGMHSGPVTAGVLRGDKGRFQVCFVVSGTFIAFSAPLISNHPSHHHHLQ
jgi:class 3 adenylate cyclase